MLFWLGFVLVGVGFVANAMWAFVPVKETALLAGLALAALVCSYALARLFHGTVATFASVVWFAALIWFVGVSSVLAVMLVVAAAIAVGDLFVPRDIYAHGLFAVLAGLAMICAIVGWLLPFPVHGHVTYVVALLGVSLVRWRYVADTVKPWAKAWTNAAEPARCSALLAVTALGVISTCAWLPTIHYDDLASHLRMAHQLGTLGYYRMDAASQVWAVSAWASDVLQSVVQLVAGHEARGAVDAMWLTVAAVAMWKLCEALGLETRWRWFAVAIYASMPLAAGTLTGMQTEGPTAAVAAGTALLIYRVSKPNWRHLVLAALLFGLMLGLKVSNVMIAGPLGLLLLWQWRKFMPWRAVPVAMLLGLFVAGSSYAYAWVLTGNPILPVYNAIFHSPYYSQTNFHDSHWNAGLHWDTLWSMVFDSSRYVEGGNGAAGFTLLAMAGGFLVALFNRRARPLALAAAVAFVLPLTQLQYLRYPFPVCALLIPVMLCGIPVDGVAWWHKRGIIAVLVLLTIGNLVFVPSGDWQLQTGELRNFLVESRTAFVGQYAPIRTLAKVVHERYGASTRILITSSAIPFAGEFGGKAFVVNWYDQQTSAQALAADRDPTGRLWTALFGRTGVNLLVLKTGDVSPALTAAVASSHGALEYADHGLQLWRLHKTRPGIQTAAPTHGVAVGFEAAEPPQHATLIHAHVDIACKPSEVPILVSWTVKQEHGAPWRHIGWIHCLQYGRAHTSVDLSVPSQIVGAEVTVQPSKDVDMNLRVLSSGMSIRRDLTADRDLARRMRNGIRDTLANWVNPLDGTRAVATRHAMPSPAGSVKAALTASSFPPGSSRIYATVILRCTPSKFPIVIGWNVDEATGESWSHYEWATCGPNGQARSSVDMLAKERVTSIMVTAVPKDHPDTRLGLMLLRASYLRMARLKGFVNGMRLGLAEWLRPEHEIRDLAP